MGKILAVKLYGKIWVFLLEGRRAERIYAFRDNADNSLRIGTILISRVTEVKKNMQGVFVSLNATEKAYLPMRDMLPAQVANRTVQSSEEIRQGDEILVQIAEDARKTKPKTVTCKLSLAGQFVVCNYGGAGISFSQKINEEKKAHLKELLQGFKLPEEELCSYVLRTNAGSLADCGRAGSLLKEMQDFTDLYQKIRSIFRSRVGHSILYSPEDEWLQAIKGIPLERYDEIVTDDRELYKQLSEQMPVRFYTDDLLPLYKMYSLESCIEAARSKKVWLDCGGYLVIEPTEAMTVIDVNSGKAENKRKSSEEFYYQVNAEAAGEIARQLILRNISGMIMVDFINMKDTALKKKLLTLMADYLKQDPVPARLVDMTALGIVEITRKKIRKSLEEELK